MCERYRTLSAKSVPQACADTLASIHNNEPDMSEIKGQHRARRALEVAAAGGHNILLVGTQYNRWNLRWWRPCQTTPNQLMGTVTEDITNLYLSGRVRKKSHLFSKP